MLSVPAIKLLLPNPTNAFVVSLVYSVDVGKPWPLSMAYIGAAYGVDEHGFIDRSLSRALGRFPEWGYDLLRNDLIENKRQSVKDIDDVWDASHAIWIDWKVVSGMVSALESGHKLLVRKKG